MKLLHTVVQGAETEMLPGEGLYFSFMRLKIKKYFYIARHKHIHVNEYKFRQMRQKLVNSMEEKKL
jgi:hypothetical protein